MKNDIQELLLALSSIYLSLAGIDSVFLDEERDAVIEKLNEWVPEANPEEIIEIIKKAAKEFRNHDQEAILKRYLNIVNRSFEDDMKFNVIKDLVDIASVDNKLDLSEVEYLKVVIKELGLSNHPNLKEYLNNLNLSNKQKTREEPTLDTASALKEDWTIIHDIACLLIFSACMTKNGINEEHLSIIKQTLRKFKLSVDNKVFDCEKYSMLDLSYLIDNVIINLFGKDGKSNEPTVGFNSSFYTLIDYYKRGQLDPANITAIVKMMFDVATIKDGLMDKHIDLFNFLVDNCRDIDPGIDVITDLVNIQIEMREIKKDLISNGMSEEDIPHTKIDPKTGKMSFDLPKQNFESINKQDKDEELLEPQVDDEIIAEVTKNPDSHSPRQYIAKVRGTDEDITDLIYNQPKLRYAYERSGLVRGKKSKEGIYIWRVIKRGTNK